MDPVHISITISILLCSLVAGLVFAFAIIVMPGIKVLDDYGFLNAFKVMDRVIQDNQPVFLFVWLGSAVAMIVLAVISVWHLDGWNRVLAISSMAIYLLGVQIPTATINIPLNNRLQALDLEAMSDSQLRDARRSFEPRWILWNSIRTVLATLATLGLIILALRI